MDVKIELQKRTKIVATIGPASQDEETLRAMVRAGMDVARINFSHGEHETHGRNIAAIRRVAEEEGVVVAVLADLPGPKLRLGDLVQDPVELKTGDQVTLTSSAELDPKQPRLIPMPHPEVLAEMSAGERLLLDDGQLEFVVRGKQGSNVQCEVITGGKLSSRKGVSVPDTRLSMSSITDEDRDHLRFALAQGVDYVAMSFVRTGDDVRELRWLVHYLKGDAALIAKIEKAEALVNFDGILDQADGIMVARGDLGVETPAEEVPIHQKTIIRRCNAVGKPVITATQMLQSMIENPRPTRAESTDVANAIFDGTDAVMLSGETAVGKYPVESVAMMARIAQITEQYLRDHLQHLPLDLNLSALKGEKQHSIPAAISHVTAAIAQMLDAKLIVASTWSGYTAQRVARVRPSTPILAATPNRVTYNRLALVWGVIPVLVETFATIDEMIDVMVKTAREAELVTDNDLMVIIGGMPFGVGSQTNFLKVVCVGECEQA